MISAASSIQVGYYRSGSDVLHIGDENRQLHIVRSGALDLLNSEGQLVTRVAEDDCFGFPSLMNATPVPREDYRIGVPEADLPNVFEPFYRAGDKRGDGEHAGLGLAIARRIVELQAGEIRVTSRAGEGTVFAFTLPLGLDKDVDPGDSTPA